MFISTAFSFIATVLFMFVFRPVAKDIGLIDHPGGRKRHDEPVPLIGGLAMSAAIGFSAVLLDLPEGFISLLLATWLLVIVGTIDDRFDLPASVRLVAQTTAAILVVYGAGIIVTDLETAFFVPIVLGPFAILFSLFFFVTLINAFNVIDGIDGLAGGTSLIALLALAVVTYGSDYFSLTLVVTAAVAAFLMFNLPLKVIRPVRSFMGDAGSTVLGLFIAAIGVAITQDPLRGVAPVVGLYFVAVPVYELFATTIRRIVAGQSPFAPDHEHLHHALVAHGLTKRQALCLMLSWAAAMVVIGLAAYFAGVEDGILLLGWLGGLALYYQAIRQSARVVRWFLWIASLRTERAA